MDIQKAMLSIGLFLVRLAICILVIVGIYSLGKTAYSCGYSIVSNAPVDPEPGRDVEVTVSGDMDIKDIAKLLERRGLISDSDIFRLQLKVNKYEDKLKPGSYELNTSMTPKEIMEALSAETVEEDEEEEEE